MDYYLLHSIQTGNYKLYDEYGIWDFVAGLKEQGLVRHWGFSFHATPELLDELLTKHPEVDFVQLQLNYADWENPDVTSRANYEVARAHNKPIVIIGAGQGRASCHAAHCGPGDLARGTSRCLVRLVGNSLRRLPSTASSPSCLACPISTA